MAIKLADTLKPMGDFPAADASDVAITLLDETKKSVQKAYEDGDLGGGGSQIQYAVMPPASEHPGEVVQYIGESGTYHKASFYSSEGEIAYCYTAIEGSYTYYFYVKEISPTATIYAKADIENPEATSINELVPISTIGVYAGLSLVSLDSGTLVLTNGSVELIFNHAAAKDLNSYVWIDQTLIDERYNPSSDNPQSGKAVAEAVAAVNPLQMKYPDGKTWQNADVTSSYYYAFGKADDGTLVAGCNGNSAVNGIKYSVDNGRTWQDTNISSGAYHAFEKADDGTLVACGDGIKYSVDNGVTWQNADVTSGTYKSFGKADDGTLVVGGTSVGIKYSVDNGVTWQDTNIISSYYNDFMKVDDGTLLTCGDGIKYSVDNGVTWQNTNMASGGYFAFGKTDDGTLVVGASSGNKGIKYSVDNGRTWQDTNVTLYYYYAFEKADDGTLVAGGTNAGIKYSPLISFKDWVRKVTG